MIDAAHYEQGEIVRDAILSQRGLVTVEFRCESQTPTFVRGLMRSAVAPMRKWLNENALIFTGVKSPEAMKALEDARDKVYGVVAW